MTSQNVYLLCQGFSYLSEVGARVLLKLAKKAFGPSKLGNLMQLDRHFKLIKTMDIRNE